MAKTIKLWEVKKHKNVYPLGDYDLSCPKCDTLLMSVEILRPGTIHVAHTCKKCNYSSEATLIFRD